MPSGVPAQSGSADHAGRRHHNDLTAGRNHDRAAVLIATAIRAAVFATPATFRGLGAEAGQAQQGGECRYRQDLSGHLVGILRLFQSNHWGVFDAVRGSNVPDFR
jgi:hypothetical protein